MAPHPNEALVATACMHQQHAVACLTPSALCLQQQTWQPHGTAAMSICRHHRQLTTALSSQRALLAAKLTECGATLDSNTCLHGCTESLGSCLGFHYGYYCHSLRCSRTWRFRAVRCFTCGSRSDHISSQAIMGSAYFMNNTHCCPCKPEDGPSHHGLALTPAQYCQNNTWRPCKLSFGLAAGRD